jgi:hypothetical protein
MSSDGSVTRLIVMLKEGERKLRAIRTVWSDEAPT